MNTQLQLEVGKPYITRNGRRAEIIDFFEEMYFCYSGLEQSAFLVSLFQQCDSTKDGRHGLRAFFDYCGARMIPGSVEHEPFDGRLTISISQNPHQ